MDLRVLSQNQLAQLPCSCSGDKDALDETVCQVLFQFGVALHSLIPLMLMEKSMVFCILQSTAWGPLKSVFTPWERVGTPQNGLHLFSILKRGN